MKRKLLSCFLICVTLVSALAVFTACGEEPVTYSNYVAIEVQDYGTIVIELYRKMAPGTVYNFQKLVSQGFYDGLTFHRVVQGFMIQGGCPKGDGSGNAGQTIPGEMMSNGFTQNTLKHTRGVVSMARSSSGYDTASCQFFIMTETNVNLDGEYAAFGKVLEGMDVVDAISLVSTDNSEENGVGGEPLEKIVMTRVYFLEDYTPTAE